jgi:3-dehydroquinate dehydratase/shikimate dehydrogenase
VAKICLCLTAKTLKRNLEILDKYRRYADLTELRVDNLEPDERLLIRRFPEQAGMPVILTIRRHIDGGQFVGGEGVRVNLMARGLAFAETDKRRNFAYLDIEDDLDVPSLEEAARTFGTRIIRSYHNTRETNANLSTKIRTMRHSEDEIVKVSVRANSTKDVLHLLKAGKECADQEKILISMGRYGTYSRILAEQFGSVISYTSAFAETDAPPAAPGQVDIQELTDLYRFRKITKSTKVYGITGNPLAATSSPHFFNAIFELEGTNAVYVPFPADSIIDFLEIANHLGLEGISVTVPYKETVIPFLNSMEDEVQSIGACNTLILTPQGWKGANTDARGFSGSLLAFLGRENFKRQRVTVIGAGGAARAVIHELYRLGAKVLILNRTAAKAAELAAHYKFAWGGLDEGDIARIEKYRDIIIQTTSVGMEGAGDASNLTDPLASYNFSGREEVMDLVYKPKMTPFLKRASNVGCNVLNGFDMLIRQAQHQYTCFTGKEFPVHLLSRIQYGEI